MTAQNDTIQVKVASISVAARLRDIDPDYVAMIASSIEERGLLVPIEVRAQKKSGYQLISGAHRLAAVKRLGWSEIPVHLFDGDAIEAEMREIDENLFRRELSELDRATFLARRKALYEAENPNVSKRGGDRRSEQATDQTDKFVHLIPSFADATAERLGIDARTIRRAIQRVERIPPDVRTRIASTHLAAKGASLDALARLEPDEQRKVVDRILSASGEKPLSVSDAQASLRGQTAPEISDDDRQYDALLSAWKRAGAKARQRFSVYLAEEKSS